MSGTDGPDDWAKPGARLNPEGQKAHGTEKPVPSRAVPDLADRKRRQALRVLVGTPLGMVAVTLAEMLFALVAPPRTSAHPEKWACLFLSVLALLAVGMCVIAVLLPLFLPRFAAYRAMNRATQLLVLAVGVAAYIVFGVGYFLFVATLHVT